MLFTKWKAKMDLSYWHKQTSEPLYPELVWSKPENKNHAGKLLIVGGNSHGFSAPAEAFTIATREGIGVVKVLLPDHIKRQLVGVNPPTLEMIFAPSTPSGSFSTKALAEMLDYSLWADGVLLAGDLGHNSETAILLEKFVSNYLGILMLTKDAVDYFVENPKPLINNSNCCLVLTIAQLQKIAIKLNYTIPFKFNMDVIQLVQALHSFTSEFKVTIILKHLNTIFVANNGNVSTTKSQPDELEAWRLRTASKAVVWWIHNPSKTFESLTVSISK